MRTKLLSASMAALIGAFASSGAYAQSSTTFTDMGSSVVEGTVGGFESAQVPSTYSDGAIGGSYDGVTDNPVGGYYSPNTPQNYYQPAPAAAPAAAPAKTNPAVGAHNVLFYKNDFSYLTDNYSGPTYFGDGLKNLSVGTGKLDIGGQIRTRYHHEEGMGQVAGTTRFQDTENDFGLVRLRLYADFKATDRLRFFVEGIYADTISPDDQYIPRGIDRNYGDFLNAFADVKLTENSTVRIGRQELLYGAQRTVSPLDWANTRRTFDGVRFLNKWGDWKIDAFYTQVVPVIRNELDRPNEDVDFYGTYATYSGWEKDTLEMYYLGLNNDSGAAGNTFNIDTFGTRLFGSRGDWSYEFEGAVQTGSQAARGQSHEAGFGTFGLGRKFSNLGWKPQLWFFYDIATGDQIETADAFERNNQLFPLAHKYLGFVDAVTRNNVASPNVRLTMAPTKKLSFLLWYYNFQSVESNDPITSIGGTPAQDVTSDDFGNELDFIATYKINPRRSVLFGYSHFWAGDRIIDGNDADFVYAQFQTNF